ncbi:MAG TPA: Crp/Fnr family transcriptional regulator [Bryobacteraceae bacterium]|nr:Crp/Fnr family transcriptional regulator [Bryobacteraceae bacterium]
MNSDVVVLDRYPFFDHFQPKHLEKLTALGSLVSFPKDAILFQEEDEDTEFYVLLSGRVALELSHAGRPLLIDTLHAGDELGCSVMLGQKNQFRARALDPVEATAFHVTDLRQAFDANPYFARAFLGRLCTVIAGRLQHTRRQLGRALAGREGP